MTRTEQHQRNRAAADRARELCAGRFIPPSYAAVVAVLNAEAHQTGWGRPWTRTALRRMLQRNGVRGLSGLFRGEEGAL